ncbi:hypothetical protein RHMOL_Rhmol11G0050400 [Rhododendron molle]|uniref:Uncharacterized protein n=1 Tax=Rhododendron molle TaxID=49168 RepID=A0ACC0LQ07_RHOML|nr:hypothetical protein RHMOL_Rhmol11G0050400 [Rhododendron molle]
MTLALMRKATKKRDIVRSGVTKFATSFLTLQSLAEKKEALKVMVTSNEWRKSKWGPSSTKGKTPYATMLSKSFWNGVSLCLKVFAPLVKVLRLVDGTIPQWALYMENYKRQNKRSYRHANLKRLNTSRY